MAVEYPDEKEDLTRPIVGASREELGPSAVLPRTVVLGSTPNSPPSPGEVVSAVGPPAEEHAGHNASPTAGVILTQPAPAQADADDRYSVAAEVSSAPPVYQGPVSSPPVLRAEGLKPTLLPPPAPAPGNPLHPMPGIAPGTPGEYGTFSPPLLQPAVPAGSPAYPPNFGFESSNLGQPQFGTVPQPPPAWSRVRIVASPAGDSVEVNIPAAGLCSAASPTGLLLLLLGSVFAWSGFSIATADYVHGQRWMALIFLGIGVLVADHGVRLLATAERIAVDAEHFVFERRLLGWPSRVGGNRRDLSYVDLRDTGCTVNGRKMYACVLGQGVAEHQFGASLLFVEQLWVLAELSRHLRLPFWGHNPC